MRNHGDSSLPQVVVLGAGFGGLGAVRQLHKAPVAVTLIDRNDYHTFQPLLYQVATAELEATEIGTPAREVLHDHTDWQFHRGGVTGIDLEAKLVQVEGFDAVPYDYLVVGLGAQVNFFGTKGAAEQAYPLYTMSDAVRLRKHILETFESVDKDPHLIDEGALTFCVVGGGSTGVEIAGALSELIATELKQDYPNLPVDSAEVHLYELGPSLLPPFKPKLQDYAKGALEERGVKVHLQEGVTEVSPGTVQLKGGQEVKSHTLVWAAGLTASPVAQMLNVELMRGRVPVLDDLSLEGHPDVFVVGDIACIQDGPSGGPLPQLGSVAQQSGVHAGENIGRMVKGHKTEPFHYKDKGTMATIGRGAAVVEFKSGRTMTGHAAWIAWLGIHLMLLSGGEEKGLTFLDWGWNMLANNRSKRIVLE